MKIRDLTKYMAVAYPADDGFSSIGKVEMEEWKYNGGYVKFEEVEAAVKKFNREISKLIVEYMDDPMRGDPSRMARFIIDIKQMSEDL